MEYMTRTFTLLLVLMCSLYREVFCRTETLSVEAKDCEPYKIRHVNGDRQYIITWKGGEIPTFCSFGFVGRGEFSSRYKVCVEATTFNVSDCRVELKYEKGVGISLYSTYSCNDKVQKFCGDSDDYVEIEFDTGFRSRPKNNDRITLKVTADMTFNEVDCFTNMTDKPEFDYKNGCPLVIGCSVAGAIVSVVLMSTSVALIIRRYQRSPTLGKVVQTIPQNNCRPPNANTWYSERGYSNQVTDQGQQATAASHFPPPT